MLGDSKCAIDKNIETSMIADIKFRYIVVNDLPFDSNI